FYRRPKLRQLVIILLFYQKNPVHPPHFPRSERMKSVRRSGLIKKDKTAKKISLNDGFMESRDEYFLLWDVGLILTCVSSVNTCAPARPHGSVKQSRESPPGFSYRSVKNEDYYRPEIQGIQP